MATPDESVCVILATGQFLPPERAVTLVRALARLFDLDWTVRITADAAWDAASIHEVAAELDVVARVTWAPVPDWTAAALFACAAEPPELDLAATEGFQHGLPVIAQAAAPGARITPDNGVVCPPGDVDQLSKAIRRLIFDTTLRADMSAAARAVAV